MNDDDGFTPQVYIPRARVQTSWPTAEPEFALFPIPDFSFGGPVPATQQPPHFKPGIFVYPAHDPRPVDTLLRHSAWLESWHDFLEDYHRHIRQALNVLKGQPDA